MLLRAFNDMVDVFRATEPQTMSGSVSWSKSVVTGVKIGNPSDGWIVSTNGTQQRRTATLFFNAGMSAETPAMSPLFRVGDMICAHSDSSTAPSDDRSSVVAVSEQRIAGKLHHIEVQLA